MKFWTVPVILIVTGLIILSPNHANAKSIKKADTVLIKQTSYFNVDTISVHDLNVRVNEFPYLKKDSLEGELTLVSFKKDSYEESIKEWTYVIYPVLSLLFTIIPFLITLLIQSRNSRKERELIEKRARDERAQLEQERRKQAAVNRIDYKIDSDKEVLNELFQFLEQNTGTNAKAKYLGLSLKNSIDIDGYPEEFKNHVDAVIELLTDFFAIDAKYYEHPHHSYLHNQLLKNIVPFIEKTVNLSDADFLLMLDRYRQALLQAKNGGVIVILMGWLEFLKGGQSDYIEQMKNNPQRILLGTVIIDSLIIIHDKVDSEQRIGAIKLLINEVMESEEFYNLIFIEKIGKQE